MTEAEVIDASMLVALRREAEDWRATLEHEAYPLLIIKEFGLVDKRDYETHHGFTAEMFMPRAMAIEMTLWIEGKARAALLALNVEADSPSAAETMTAPTPPTPATGT